jgi:hypothetical protein
VRTGEVIRKYAANQGTKNSAQQTTKALQFLTTDTAQLAV